MAIFTATVFLSCSFVRPSDPFAAHWSTSQNGTLPPELLRHRNDHPPLITVSLTIEHLTKHFQTDEGESITAVDDVNMEIKDGEFVVFVGPSGCGKTTTLRCIAGLETPSSGNIYMNGAEITNTPPQERDIAMVFQNYALYPHLSIRDNLGFGLRNRTDLSDEEINTNVEEVAEILSISELLDNKPGQLSGGQQQRVATGRAIIREPEVFLMDEPLSNLDARLRKQMRIEIQRLQEDLEVTTIYVTHNQEEAMTMADKIIILNRGRVQQIGTPDEVYRSPTNQFVAEFIGDPKMNVIPIDIRGGSIQLDGLELKIEEEDAKGSDRNFSLGVRPNDVKIVSEGIKAEVDVFEKAGDHNLIYLKTGYGDFTIKAAPTVAPAIGENIEISFSRDDIYLFDRDSGKSMITPGQVPVSV